MIFDGWCPDCDMRTAVVDTGDVSDSASSDSAPAAWATCTECEAGWVWRDEIPEQPSSVRRHAAAERRAA